MSRTPPKPKRRPTKNNNAPKAVRMAVFDVEKDGRFYTITARWYVGTRQDGHMPSMDEYPKAKALAEASRLAVEAVNSGRYDVARVTLNDQSEVYAEYLRP